MQKTPEIPLSLLHLFLFSLVPVITVKGLKRLKYTGFVIYQFGYMVLFSITSLKLSYTPVPHHILFIWEKGLVFRHLRQTQQRSLKYAVFTNFLLYDNWQYFRIMQSKAKKHFKNILLLSYSYLTVVKVTLHAIMSKGTNA